MDVETLTDAALDPLPLAIPAERLYRATPGLYQSLIESGLLADGVAIRDGLLVIEPAGRLYRMPVDIYDRVGDLGLLDPGDRIELIDGLLVKKMTKGNFHVVATKLVMEAIRSILPAGFHVTKEDPIVLPSGPKGHASEPEPDVSIVRGGARDYLTRKPGPGDVALVVEISETSLREDREKMVRYAWAGLPAAWLVNLADRNVEVRSDPSGAAGYRHFQTFIEGQTIPVVIDDLEVSRVAVADLLP